MVKLQPRRFATALAASVDVSAAIPITLEDGATYGCRHVSVALAR
jgi:hypothetical protein